MNIKPIARASLCVIALAVTLAGCGGGGGNTANNNSNLRDALPVPTQLVNAATKTSAIAFTVADKIATAAMNSPNRGSVTQPSTETGQVSVNVDVVHAADGPRFTVGGGHPLPDSGITTTRVKSFADKWNGSELKADSQGVSHHYLIYSDIEKPADTGQVRTEVKPDTSNKRLLSVGDKATIKGETTVRSSSQYGTLTQTLAVLYAIRTDRFINNRGGGGYDRFIKETRGVSGTLNGVSGEFYCDSPVLACQIKSSKGNAYGISYDGSVSQFNGTVTFVPTSETKTKITKPDTDYLSLGVWVLIPADPKQAGEYEVGVFADGADPFAKNRLAGLTGSATYSGNAGGLHTSVTVASGGATIDDFTADVRLTADFGDGSALGTVSGAVSEFEVGGKARNMTIDLGSADITNGADGGFFNGDTSADGGFIGKWGGQFYGNGSSATDDHPNSASGTFGATSNSNSGMESFVGAFGAYEQ